MQRWMQRCASARSRWDTNEALSLSFISHADAERFSSSSNEMKVLELENPLSEEASVMRTSLAPGMLDMLAWNLNRDVPEARLFEMGSVYGLSNQGRIEPKRACLGATAAAIRASLPVGGALDVSKNERAAAAETFRGFKGDVENLLAAFASGYASFDREDSGIFSSGTVGTSRNGCQRGGAVWSNSSGRGSLAKITTRCVFGRV